jgi:hypothetical protein
VGSLVLAAQRSARDIRVGAVTVLVFAAGVLIASSLHLDLFSAGGLADWLWFGSFTAATAGLGAVVAWSLRVRKAEVGR